jgi:hypothetical protein
LDLAVGLGIIEQTGSTYSFNGEKLGYAKSFVNKTSFWDGIIPLIDERIKTEWAYSSEQAKTINEMENEIEQEKD